MIKTFWHQSPNFGDALTPYLFKKLGVDFEYVDKGCKEDHFIICGSILTAANEHSIIWGAGVAQYYNMIKPKQVAALRGVETHAFLIDQGIEEFIPVYGDISMLLPILYPKERNQIRKQATIDHIALFDGNGWNVGSHIEETIDYILGCDIVTTTSFHIKLACDAYGVPCYFVPNDKVIGAEFKYKDYTSTKNQGLYDIDRFINSCPIEEIKNKLNEIRSGHN